MGMAGYTKLFNSILASTIWREDDKTRIVWITLLAMADKNGVAECSIPGLADLARVTVSDCRLSLDKLQQPDPDSRTKEHEGRRIAPTDGGFQILNHSKYRAKLSQDERREYLKIKQAEFRKRKQQSTKVNNVSNKSTPSTHTEAEAYTEAEAIEPKPLSVLSEPDELLSAVERVWNYYIKLFNRKSTYTFTKTRAAKGLARFIDCMKLTGGDKEQAALLMKQAVDALHSSEYHLTEGYYDWIDNLFKSTDQLQKWLDKPESKGKRNGNQSRQQEDFDNIDRAVERMARKANEGHTGNVPKLED